MDDSKTAFMTLHGAACKGDTQQLNALLQTHRFNLDAKNQYGDTPLQLACIHGNNAVAEALLAAGADVNIADRDIGTPLYLAIVLNNAPLVDILLRYGADIHYQQTGVPLLVEAEARSFDNIAISLLGAGATRTGAPPSAPAHTGTSSPCFSGIPCTPVPPTDANPEECLRCSS